MVIFLQGIGQAPFRKCFILCSSSAGMHIDTFLIHQKTGE